MIVFFALTFWNTPEILFYAQFHVYFLNLYAAHGCICLSTILTSELVSSEQLFCHALMGYWSFFICSKSVVITHIVVCCCCSSFCTSYQVVTTSLDLYFLLFEVEINHQRAASPELHFSFKIYKPTSHVDSINQVLYHR